MTKVQRNFSKGKCVLGKGAGVEIRIQMILAMCIQRLLGHLLANKDEKYSC